MTTKEEQKQIAVTILAQLGGRRFMAMTGSKNMLYDANWLRMDLAKNKSGANQLRITLQDNDTYKMEFYRFTLNRKTFDYKITEKANFEGIYADQLQSIFTEVTGMYTSL
ncbi:MAG: hypothetical protein KDD04_03170 [Sinomicrobium sp.]|nr:hypothetical protein [Sinomicrobium sp.]